MGVPKGPSSWDTACPAHAEMLVELGHTQYYHQTPFPEWLERWLSSQGHVPLCQRTGVQFPATHQLAHSYLLLQLQWHLTSLPYLSICVQVRIPTHVYTYNINKNLRINNFKSPFQKELCVLGALQLGLSNQDQTVPASVSRTYCLGA